MKLNKKILVGFITTMLSCVMVLIIGFKQPALAAEPLINTYGFTQPALATEPLINTYQPVLASITNPYYTFELKGGPYSNQGVVYKKYRASDMTKYNKIYTVKSTTTLFAETKKGSKSSLTPKGRLNKNTYVVIGATKTFKGVKYTQVQVVQKNNSVYTISTSSKNNKSKGGWVMTKDLKDVLGSQYIIGQAWYGTKYSSKNKSLYDNITKCTVRKVTVSIFKY